MRVLLDEHLPVRLAAEFIGHAVSTVREQGWEGLSNGMLLAEAQRAGFEVLVTNDGSLEFQQNLEGVTLGIVVLDAPSNKLEDLSPRVPDALEAVVSVRPGEVRHVAG